MAERLNPNDHQQEQRAEQAKALADRIEQQFGDNGGKVTLKGEAIEVENDDDAMVITANGDATFSIQDGPSHIGADDMLKRLAS